MGWGYAFTSTGKETPRGSVFFCRPAQYADGQVAFAEGTRGRRAYVLEGYGLDGCFVVKQPFEIAVEYLVETERLDLAVDRRQGPVIGEHIRFGSGELFLGDALLSDARELRQNGGFGGRDAARRRQCDVDVDEAGVESQVLTSADGKRRRLFFDLGKDGRTVELTGAEPFNVLFGNPGNVAVRVNGEDYALPATSRPDRPLRLTVSGT